MGVQSNNSEGSEFWSTYIYNTIPSRYLNGKILELGARDGTPQLQSIHREKFLSDGYLGIDLIVPEESKIKVQSADARLFDYGKEEWDTFLTIATLEHIDFFEWEGLLNKWKKGLKPGGHIIILTPYKETPYSFFTTPDYKTNQKQSEEYGEWVGHRVFGIDEKIYQEMLGDLVFVKKFTQLAFREEGESLIWASLRFVKRFLTGHPYVWNWIKRRNLIMVIYEKPLS